MESNSGVLEHPESTLSHIEGQSPIGTDQAAGAGLPGSSRKTSLLMHTNGLLFDAVGADKCFKERSIMITESTRKGSENGLFNHKVQVFTTNEVASSIDIPGFSDAKSGINFFPKQRLISQTQTETISIAVSAGICTLSANSYRFACQLLGQHKPMEAYLTPNPQAAHKRFKVTFPSEDWAPQPGADGLLSVQSHKLIADFHDWSHRRVRAKKQRIVCDGFALSCYEAFSEGIVEWIVDQGDLDKYWKVKLEFYRSDSMRAARFMRVATFLVDADGAVLRCEVNLEELSALWSWRRDVHLHRALYKYLKRARDALPSSGPFIDAGARQRERCEETRAVRAPAPRAAAIFAGEAGLCLCFLFVGRLSTKCSLAPIFIICLSGRFVMELCWLLNLTHAVSFVCRLSRVILLGSHQCRQGPQQTIASPLSSSG